MYLTNITWLDMCYSVNKLSQYMEQPKTKYWKNIKKILNYIKKTIDYGLLYRCDKGDLYGYSDSDFAGDTNSWKSTTGFVYLNAEGVIFWVSQKQCCGTVHNGSQIYSKLCCSIRGYMVAENSQKLDPQKTDDPLVYRQCKCTEVHY